MPDRLADAQRSLNMSKVRRENTEPEILLRRAMHSLGFRYALHKKDLPGSPDIVLTKYRTAVFVHGCFWHGHSCYRAKIPSTRSHFWKRKIEANRVRDARVTNQLKQLGWRVVVVWECALKGRKKIGGQMAAAACASFLRQTGASYVDISSEGVFVDLHLQPMPIIEPSSCHRNQHA